MHCTTPADIYIVIKSIDFIKSSDFISYDLDPETAYEGCDDIPDDGVRIELILKSFVQVSPSRDAMFREE